MELIYEEEVATVPTAASYTNIIEIRDRIEALPKFNQIEILRLLRECHGVTLNENKYGIHINMSDLPKAIIDKMAAYIFYVNSQELDLQEVELQKQEFKNTFFSKTE